MIAIPLRCVIDTNVAVTANGANEGVSADCVVVSAQALQAVMQSGHVFIDDDRRIMTEYVGNLSQRGQPGPGNAFLKWMLVHEWVAERVTHVRITPRDDDPNGFLDLPRPPAGVTYDPSDCKFLAVSRAHCEHPQVLQASDSKWWGWREALEAAGIGVCFVCPDDIATKYALKMG